MRDLPCLTWLLAACLAAFCAPARAAAPTPGQVTILVGQDGGGGVRGLAVLLDDADIASTDAAGAATISVSIGAHVLTVRRGTLNLSESALNLRDGEAAELRLSVPDGQGLPAARLEVFDVANPGIGALGGTITDETGEPLAGAAIRVEGSEASTTSDGQGRFELRVPRGTWDVVVTHPEKTLTRTFNAQRVSPGVDTDLRLALTERRAAPTGAGIEEVVATARYVPDTSTALEQSSDTVLDAISEQEIAIAGDSDAAAALTRVTGVTIVNDLVFVRGLGDRYSATYVNHGEVPSPDPSRRAIGLNIFPTDILAGISVQKTYSPDLPGDFSGGAVLLDTRGIPDAFNVSLGVSAGGNTRSTNRDGLSYQGGSTDWQGRDDGVRDIPDVARQLTDNGRRPLGSLSLEDNRLNALLVEQVGDSLQPNWDVEIGKIAPDGGIDFAIGDRYEGWDRAELGYQVTLLYDRKTRFREEARTNLIPGDPRVIDSSNLALVENLERTSRAIDSGGIVSLAAVIDDEQTLGYTGILSRQTTQSTFYSEGFGQRNDILNSHAYSLDWVENQLMSHQLTGKHVFPGFLGISLNWQATKASADSDTLDRREYQYTRRADSEPDAPFELSKAAGSPTRTWEFLDDGTADAGADLSLPLALRPGLDLELSAGLRRTDRSRSFQKVGWAYRLSSSTATPADVGIALLAPSLDQVLDPRFIRPDGWELVNVGAVIPDVDSADSYDASQDLSAYYGAAKLTLGSALELQGGARKETSDIRVGLVGVDPVGAPPSCGGTNPDAAPTCSDLKDSKWLPAANLSWFINDRQTLRAGYSRTVNRPQFREIAPITYIDPETRDLTFGNLDLEIAQIRNYDLRYEYYWNPSEGITAATFAKDITRPIEVVVTANAVGRPFVGVKNARSASLYGIELDGRWELDEFADFSQWLGYTYISGNVSLIESNVKLDPAPEFCVPPVNVSERDLQGQSPWIANVTLGFSNPDSETDFALLFNMFGERIVRAGLLDGCAGLPDAVEQPAPQLDLNLRQHLFDRWKIGFKVRNLLDPDVEVVQGPFTTRSYKTGRSASFSVEYEF
ncbi:MAG: TonB-dependent receptor domain-containing protein [Panacagrimonas sp.]